ncbi:MAG: tyrosine-type recombinase/integrase [Deltaproteobacteria bacterium]|nr:tyrosine-type recombinase/integrase [Deltaproteobacteria bacterium]
MADLVARDALDAPEPEPDTEARPARTVKDLMEYWLATQEDRGDLRPVSVREYRNRAGSVTRILGDVLLDRVDRTTLEGFRDRRMHAGKAPRTVASEVAALAAAWRWGREVGHAPDRNLPRVPILIRDVRDKLTPTPGEVAAVLSRLSGWKALAVLLLYGSGCRLGEVSTLTWDRVDLEAGEIRVEGKTGARVVPLPAHVVKALAAAPRTGPRVLGRTRGSVPALLGPAIKVACEDAKIRHWTPHGLRRAACDLMYRSGVDVGTAAAFLGHSPAVALQYYRKATLEDVRAAARKAGLGRLPAGKVVRLRTG